MSKPIRVTNEISSLLLGAQEWTLLLPDPGAEAVQLPLFMEAITAGFPSPANGYEEARLDINKLVIQHPEATFFLKVDGPSMIDANIYPGDLVVVSRAVQPAHGFVVIAEVDGGFTVKTLWRRNGRIGLIPANKAFKPRFFESDEQLEIFGVVTYVIHRCPH